MPSESEDQRRYIFAMRSKYKTKSNTPENMKWIWDKEWEQVKKGK